MTDKRPKLYFVKLNERNILKTSHRQGLCWTPTRLNCIKINYLNTKAASVIAHDTLTLVMKCFNPIVTANYSIWAILDQNITKQTNVKSTKGVTSRNTYSFTNIEPNNRDINKWAYNIRKDFLNLLREIKGSSIKKYFLKPPLQRLGGGILLDFFGQLIFIRCYRMKLLYQFLEKISKYVFFCFNYFRLTAYPL